MIDEAYERGQLAAKLEALMEAIRDLKADTRERLDRIDDRLDAGDKRFREADKQRAADGVVKAIATKVGAGVILVVSSIGLAVLSHIPFIAEWLLPPKGH